MSFDEFLEFASDRQSREDYMSRHGLSHYILLLSKPEDYGKLSAKQRYRFKQSVMFKAKERARHLAAEVSIATYTNALAS